MTPEWQQQASEDVRRYKAAVRLAIAHGDTWRQLTDDQKAFYLVMARDIDDFYVRELTCEREHVAPGIVELKPVERTCASGRAGCERIMAMGK